MLRHYGYILRIKKPKKRVCLEIPKHLSSKEDSGIRVTLKKCFQSAVLAH